MAYINHSVSCTVLTTSFTVIPSLCRWHVWVYKELALGSYKAKTRLSLKPHIIYRNFKVKDLELLQEKGVGASSSIASLPSTRKVHGLGHRRPPHLLLWHHALPWAA